MESGKRKEWKNNPWRSIATDAQHRTARRLSMRNPLAVTKKRCEPRARPAGGSRFSTRGTRKNVLQQPTNRVSADSASRFRFSEHPLAVGRIAPVTGLSLERIAPLWRARVGRIAPPHVRRLAIRPSGLARLASQVTERMPPGTGGEPAVPQAIDAAIGAGAGVAAVWGANAERGFPR